MRTPRLRSVTGALLGLMIAANVLSACAGPSSGAGTASTNTLNVYLYQKPKLFSPLEPANGPDQVVMSLVFDSLLGLDTHAQLQPHLVTAMPSVTQQGTGFTFTLRGGLSWSDGKPFTAQDVVYTFNTLANPRSGDAISGYFADVQGDAALRSGTATTLSGLTAPDPNTVVVKTNSADLSVLSTIATLPILPQHVLGSVPLSQLASNNFFSKPTVGLGPYQFVDYQTDQYVELRANPYYRNKVNIGIVYLKTVTSDVATAQLDSGELDLAQITPIDLPTVRNMSNVAVSSVPGTGYTRIALNQTQPRFADVRVRQAFLYAIDRKKLVADVLAGKGSVPNSSFIGDTNTSGLNGYAYDPAKARQLLTEAGWDASKSVTLAWVPGTRDRDTAATIVQSELQAVGVTVRLQQTQASQLLDEYANSDYDMVLFGGGDYQVDPWATDSILACDQAYPAGGNIPHFCDPSIDATLTKANATADATTRVSLYHQAAVAENQQAAYLWLYNPDTVWASSRRLRDAMLGGDFTHPFVNIDQWRLTS